MQDYASSAAASDAGCLACLPDLPPPMGLPKLPSGRAAGGFGLDLLGGGGASSLLLLLSELGGAASSAAPSATSSSLPRTPGRKHR